MTDIARQATYLATIAEHTHTHANNFKEFVRMHVNLNALIETGEEDGMCKLGIVLMSDYIERYMETDLLALKIPEEEYKFDLLTISDTKLAGDQVLKVARQLRETIEVFVSEGFEEFKKEVVKNMASVDDK